MSPKELLDTLLTLGAGQATLGAVLLAAIAYVMFWPDQARSFGGLLLAVIARAFHQVDKRAVAMRVEGDVNSARGSLLRDAPEVIQGKLKIQWAKGEEAAAIVRGGDVVVVMRRSSFHEENVAHAVMAYLPRSVVPLARHYLPRLTMQAVDFTTAKALLSQARSQAGALAFLLEQHVEPARRANPALGERLVAIDEIDLHGWLSRVLLSEFSRLGQVLYPGSRDDRFEAEADALVEWLCRLARRIPGDESVALEYRGRFFKVAVVLVARAVKLYGEGLAPYRRRVVRLLYREKMDVVYLMARDENIAAARALVDAFVHAGGVEPGPVYEYALRSDFAAKRLPRERAVCVALRRRGDQSPVDESTVVGEAEIPEELFEPTVPEGQSATSDAFPFDTEKGAIAELITGRQYGFITDASNRRVFFHESELVNTEFRYLRVGDEVVFKRGFDPRRNKPRAEHVKLATLGQHRVR